VEADPLDVWAVIDEIALRRQVGSAAITHEQLLPLSERTKLSNVAIQVIPLNTPHTAPGWNFHLLNFEDPDDKPVLYVDTLPGGMASSNMFEIERGRRLWGHLRGNVQSPKDSAVLIEEIAGDLWTSRGCRRPMS
jgi:hypothetical protein